MTVSLSRHERVLLLVMALALIAYAGVALVHRPLSQSLAAARERLDRADTELRRAERDLAREGDLADREARVRDREAALAALVPGRHAASLFVHHLSRAEQAAGVTVRAIRAEKVEQVGGLMHLYLSMEVTGTFLSHVLFHQDLEEVPLFFRVGDWTLERRTDAEMTAALRLYEQGRQDQALASLRGSPDLFGTYALTVYFKAERPGPDTGDLGYGEAGRIDPFSSDRVAEFLVELRRHYPDGPPAGPDLPATGAPGPGGPGPSEPAPDRDPAGPMQLG